MLLKKAFNTPKKCIGWIALLICIIVLYLVIFDRIAPNTSAGYVNTYVVEITSRFPGHITEVYAKDNSFVKKGDPLFQIDPYNYNIESSIKHADLIETEEDIKRLELKIEHVKEEIVARQSDYLNTLVLFNEGKKLYSDGVMSFNDFLDIQDRLVNKKESLLETQDVLLQVQDELGPSFNGKNIHLIQAEADYDRAKYNLRHTTVEASMDGYITNLRIQSGFFAKQGDTQLVLIDTESWWIVSHFKENNLDRIRLGQRALVTLDMYPGKVFRAEVMSIGYGVNLETTLPDRYLPFIEKSNDWVQLAQRFPVKMRIIDPMDDYPLRVGATADVTVFTTDSSICNALPTLIHWIRAELLYVY